MKVTRTDLEGQTILLSVLVQKEDYSPIVEKQLKDYRKKANIPGFRVGMAPMSVIKKMYGKSTLVDVAYKAATDKALEELKTQEIEPLGDLMPAEPQPQLDFENGEEFEFIFEVGLSPKVNLELSAEDNIEKFVLIPTDEMIDGYKNNFLRQYGKLEDVEAATKDEAITCVLDNGDMRIEDAYVGLISMSDEERAPFIGKKAGDKMNVNINTLYTDVKQRAAILSLKEEELESVNPEFELEITQVRAFVNPEINEEFLAMVFPEGDVKTAEDFEKRILANVETELASQVEFKWEDNVRDYLLEKAALTLPDEFLKRWLYSINEEKFSMEEIEKEFPQFAKLMKWDLIKRQIVKADSLEIKEEDVMAEAKGMAMAAFRQYGLASAADDMLENYAKQMLSNKDEARKIFDRVGEKKTIAAIVEKITVKEVKMTVEEFSEMMKK
ncbi:MAG: trigger factor [Rikenellaceae bacterium]